VRSYIEPFANWLWGGALLMAFGGLLSLSDRRYRVAAGARRVPRGCLRNEDAGKTVGKPHPTFWRCS
jgi:cytochrome c biogenesis factor